MLTLNGTPVTTDSKKGRDPWFRRVVATARYRMNLDSDRAPVDWNGWPLYPNSGIRDMWKAPATT